MANLLNQLKQIIQARAELASLAFVKRNAILKSLAKNLLENQKKILAANKKDLKTLKRPEMQGRLELNDKKIKLMAKGLLDLAKLPEVLNKVLETRRPKNGLVIKKLSVPLGTVAVIYESRPNVTVDLAGMAIKTGNALVLKGSKEAHSTNHVLVDLIHSALKQSGLSSNLVTLINPGDDWQSTLLNAHDLIDVIIPRGGESLIKWVRENSKIPIIETGAGVCHTFVDDVVDAKTKAKIIINAKTQAPSVCNALDTLVINRSAINILPASAPRLAKFGVQIFADASSFKILKNIYPSNLLFKARAADYGKEFLSLKMSIKTVNNFEEGLRFIKEKTSGHSESILSKNKKHIARFLNEIDAAVVYANASTRFSDGGEFGFGAEVGISTQKLHARGPMGLEALTSYKWIATGSGQTRK